MVKIGQLKDKKKLYKHIRAAVCHMYEAVSQNPDLPFHFPVGKKAALNLGYPKEMLAKIPSFALESFAGVSYHFKTNTISEGDFVLDIGSGSGTDILISSHFVGEKGRVIGIDITESMIKKAQKAISSNGFANVNVVMADATKLPFKSNIFDAVISNGVINLVPEKDRVFKEIYRVLKPGGKLSIADIVLGKSLSEESKNDPDLWAECVAGASLSNNYLDTIKKAGFDNVKLVETLDYFSLSRSKHTKEIANYYNAFSAVFTAISKKGVRLNDRKR